MDASEELIKGLIRGIRLPDGNAGTVAQKYWDSIAKPLGSLGLFESIIVKIAVLKETADVRISKPCLIVFCADNGVVARGVTQCGSEVTAKVAAALAENRSSVSPMAEATGCKVLPVDVGIMNFAGHPGVLNCRVRNGTENIDSGPAMTRDECFTAMAAGAKIAKELVSKGTDLLLVGEMGIGNTTTAAAVASALLGLPAEEVTGRGAGLSTEGLRRKQEIIRKALLVNRPNPADPADVLQKVGGLDLAAMCGAYLGSAACRVPAVTDGFISSVAALCAVRLCPDTEKALIASHVSSEPASIAVLEALGQEAPLHAKMHLGEGSGAVMLLPLLQTALKLYHSGQNFAGLGIDAYVPQN